MQLALCGGGGDSVYIHVGVCVCVCVCVCDACVCVGVCVMRVCGGGVIMFINVWRYVVVHVSYCARVPSVEDGGGAVCVSVCLHACMHGASKPLRKREDKDKTATRKKMVGAYQWI